MLATTDGAPPSTDTTYGLRLGRLTAAALLAIVIVVIATVFVVAVVLGLHVWGAIMDGREERAMRGWRRRGRGQ